MMKLIFMLMAGVRILGLGPKDPIVDAPGGPQVCVRSYWQEPVWVLHEDSLGHVLPFADAVIRTTGQIMCGRWEFRNRAGRFLYVIGADTIAGAWIRPWDKPKQ